MLCSVKKPTFLSTITFVAIGAIQRKFFFHLFRFPSYFFSILFSFVVVVAVAATVFPVNDKKVFCLEILSKPKKKCFYFLFFQAFFFFFFAVRFVVLLSSYFSSSLYSFYFLLGFICFVCFTFFLLIFFINFFCISFFFFIFFFCALFFAHKHC